MLFSLKRGDTVPPLQAQLIGVDGKPVPLAVGDAVKFVMKPLLAGSPGAISRTATVVDLPTGVVEYQWVDGDTDFEGVYGAEFRVTFLDGTVESFPNNEYIDVRVLPDLATQPPRFIWDYDGAGIVTLRYENYEWSDTGAILTCSADHSNAPRVVTIPAGYSGQIRVTGISFDLGHGPEFECELLSPGATPVIRTAQRFILGTPTD